MVKFIPLPLNLWEKRTACRSAKSNLCVVIAGYGLKEHVEQLLYFGADKIYYLEHELLRDYSTDAYSKVISELIIEKKPEIVLIGATSIGRDLGPRLAAIVGTGLTADCTKLEIDEEDGKLLQTRPAFGGNLMATIICPKNRPQMSTVRPGVMKKAEHHDTATGTLETIVPKLEKEDLRTVLVKKEDLGNKRVNLIDAKIIVSGEEGLQKEGFALIQEQLML